MIRRFTNKKEDEEKEERNRKSLLLVSGKDIFFSNSGKREGSRMILVKKKLKNKPWWKSEGVILKEQEDSRHRWQRKQARVRGGEGQAPGPLRRVQLVRMKRKHTSHWAWGQMKLGASGQDPILAPGCERVGCT